MNKNNFYKIGFSLFGLNIISYILLLVGKIIVSRSYDANGIVKFMNISLYTDMLFGILLFLIVIIISIAEINSNEKKLIRILSTINILSILLIQVVNIGFKLFIRIDQSNMTANSLNTMALIKVSIIDLLYLSIITIMVICYRSKKQIANINPIE